MNDEQIQKVLVVGTYSGLNKGDQIMQKVTINAVENCGMVPVVSSPFPKLDRQFYRGVQVVKCSRRNLPLSFLYCFILLLTPSRLRVNFAKLSKELNGYLDAEFIIDTSGDMLTEDYGIHIAISHLIPLFYCVLLKKRFLLLAQSIGPFRRLGFLFDRVLSEASKISVRDEITFNYLEQRGIKNIASVADLGFLFTAKKMNLNGSFVVKGLSRPIVGICPSAIFFQKFSKNISQINVDDFCQMLNEIATEGNYSYVMFPHVMTPNGKMDDGIFSAQLADKLKVECKVVDFQLDPASIKGLVSKIDVMVSFRMHGAIAALDEYVPTIAVSYSHKTQGLFDKLGLIQWVVHRDEDMIKNLGLKIKNIVDNKVELRRYLQSTIPNIRRQAAKNIDFIREMKV